MTHTAIRDLRRVYEQFQRDQNIEPVISQVRSMDAVGPEAGPATLDAQPPLSREDLHLVCFDDIWS